VQFRRLLLRLLSSASIERPGKKLAVRRSDPFDYRYRIERDMSSGLNRKTLPHGGSHAEPTSRKCPRKTWGFNRSRHREKEGRNPGQNRLSPNRPSPNQPGPDLKHGETEVTEVVRVEIPRCSLRFCVLKTTPANATGDPTATVKAGALQTRKDCRCPWPDN
jgi:hypothetical protein